MKKGFVMAGICGYISQIQADLFVYDPSIQVNHDNVNIIQRIAVLSVSVI